MNLAQSNGTETVCDCFHLTPFSLFMDWTGECFGLPSSPALDIITRVRIPSFWFLVKHIGSTKEGLQVFLAMSLLCLFFVEGCKYCKQDLAKEKFTFHQISRSHRRSAQRFCNIQIASSSFKFFSCSPSTSSCTLFFLGLPIPFQPYLILLSYFLQSSHLFLITGSATPGSSWRSSVGSFSPTFLQS